MLPVIMIFSNSDKKILINKEISFEMFEKKNDMT